MSLTILYCVHDIGFWLWLIIWKLPRNLGRVCAHWIEGKKKKGEGAGAAEGKFICISAFVWSGQNSRWKKKEH